MVYVANLPGSHNVLQAEPVALEVSFHPPLSFAEKTQPTVVVRTIPPWFTGNAVWISCGGVAARGFGEPP